MNTHERFKAHLPYIIFKEIKLHLSSLHNLTFNSTTFAMSTDEIKNS